MPKPGCRPYPPLRVPPGVSTKGPVPRWYPKAMSAAIQYPVAVPSSTHLDTLSHTQWLHVVVVIDLVVQWGDHDTELPKSTTSWCQPQSQCPTRPMTNEKQARLDRAGEKSLEACPSRIGERTGRFRCHAIVDSWTFFFSRNMSHRCDEPLARAASNLVCVWISCAIVTTSNILDVAHHCCAG